MVKGSLEDTSVLRRVEQGFDWKGRGKRDDVSLMGCQLGSESKGRGSQWVRRQHTCGEKDRMSIGK